GDDVAADEESLRESGVHRSRAVLASSWPPRRAALICKDGSARDAEVATFAVTFESTRCRAIVVREARAPSEAELLRRDRMGALETLAMGAAHEINNPLTYALANAEFLERKLRVHAARGGELPTALMLDAVADALHGICRVRDVVRTLITFAHGAAPEKRRL